MSGPLARLSERRQRRLKQRLVAEVVRDNVALARGERPRRDPRPRSRWIEGLRLLAIAVLPLSLFAPSHGVGDRQPATVALAAAPVAAPVTLSTLVPPAGALPPALSPPDRLHPGSLEPVDPAVFPLAVERVVLDPGHGGRNGGTQTSSGLVEKELTLDIARRLSDLLEESGYEVLLTRDDDTAVSLEERARFANESGADLFVSIHVNWIVNRGVRGVETYYLGPTDDPYLSRLAAAENRDSGYSQTDLRDLVDTLYAGLRQDSSERAASALQRSMLRSLRTVNPAVENRGVKSAPFIVLMKTDMPAVLAEVSCLSNEKEAELLARPLYRQYIAEALHSGIESFAAQPEAEGEEPDAGGTRL